MTLYHCLYVMAPTRFMTSYPLYMMSHTLCVWQHKLYIWLETHSICHHIHCICHHTHSVEDITGVICMPSCALYMTPYPAFKTTTLSVYDITCPLLMISHALYMTCHLLCIIWYSLYVWHHPMPVSLTFHTIFDWWYHTIRMYKITLSAQLQTLPTLVSSVTESWSPWPKLRHLSQGFLWKLESMRS